MVNVEPMTREQIYRREYGHWSDAKRRGIAVVERFRRTEIYLRDGGRCGVCGREVEYAKATLDHIVPLSRGGYHTRSNVRIAHLDCNANRAEWNYGDARFSKYRSSVPRGQTGHFYRDREFLEQVIQDATALRERYGYKQPAFDSVRLFRNLGKLTEPNEWEHPFGSK